MSLIPPVGMSSIASSIGASTGAGSRVGLGTLNLGANGTDLLGDPSATGAAGAAAGTSGTSSASSMFGNAISNALDSLTTSQNKVDALAQQAATGDLSSVSDYMMASTESQLLTQLTVAVRNKAVDAFNEIMRMQI